MGSIIIANQAFEIDAKVINYRDAPKYDATSEYCVPTAVESNPPCKISAEGFHIPYGNLPVPYTKRYSLRPALRRYGKNPPLEAAKASIKQFILHHDGCTSAEMCFNVLQNERGLSCHFIIDNDGTIIQTIDLALMAYHAAEYNLASIGVEFCNRGDAFKFPGVYDSGRFGPKRDVLACKINNHTYKAYEYTEAQRDSFRRLAKALTKLLPNIPVEYPQSAPGEQAWRTLDNAFSFAGYMGHYHCTNQKWDPGPWDFKSFCKSLRGAFCFPMFVKDDPKRTANDKPEIPKRNDELLDIAKALYKANETGADGGYFPVGPWGEHRLWHGGVHLAAKENSTLFSPFPGRIVAARMGPPTTIGSTNFVLIRHDLSLGQSQARFYTLVMHLANELPQKPADRPVWMAEVDWQKQPPNTVAQLDIPVEAGAIVGRVGKAGPAEYAKAQVHLEMFATSAIFTDIPGAPWELVDGSAGGRFCDADAINLLIDRNKDGMHDRNELSTFYASGDSSMYFKVVLHASEWTENPSWFDALRVPKEFRSLDKDQLEALIAEQITPGLWWTEAVAKHAKLPPDGVVYHYHPVTLIRWLNEKIIEASALPGHEVDEAAAATAPENVSDDGDGESGANMRSSADVVGDPCDTNLGLEEMVLGYEAPECAP